MKQAKSTEPDSGPASWYSGSVSLLLAILTAVLFLISTGVASAAPYSSREALNDLNRWRAEAGIRQVEIVDPQIDEGCRLHNKYMDKTGELGHDENPASPWYTALGASAGTSSVLSSVPELPRAAFEDAVYHRSSLLNPRLDRTGYSSEFGHTCMGTRNGSEDEVKSANLELFPWPSDGQTGVPLRFWSNESPDPYDEAPGVKQLGYLISVAVNGPWDRYSYGSFIREASLVDEFGKAVPVAVSDENSKQGGYLDGGFGLFPKRALDPGRWYSAHAVGVVQGTVGSKEVNSPFDLNWRFRTLDGPPRSPNMRLRKVKRTRKTVTVEILHAPGLVGQVVNVRVRGAGNGGSRAFAVTLTEGRDRFNVNRPGPGRYGVAIARIGKVEVNHTKFRSGWDRIAVQGRERGG